MASRCGQSSDPGRADNGISIRFRELSSEFRLERLHRSIVTPVVCSCTQAGKPDPNQSADSVHLLQFWGNYFEKSKADLIPFVLFMATTFYRLYWKRVSRRNSDQFSTVPQQFFSSAACTTEHILRSRRLV